MRKRLNLGKGCLNGVQGKLISNQHMNMKYVFFISRKIHSTHILISSEIFHNNKIGRENMNMGMHRKRSKMIKYTLWG